MDDNGTTPVPQQAAAPAPAGSDQQQATDWQARYAGLQKRTEELVRENRALSGDLTLRSSELEQLQAQIAAQSTEHTSALEALRLQLGEKETLFSQTQAELAEAMAFRQKVGIIQEVDPGLLPLAHLIPNGDPDAMKAAVNQLAEFGHGRALAREQQLRAGETPPNTVSQSQPARPVTFEGWRDYVEKFPLGSTERSKALDEMGVALAKANNA